MSEVVIVEATKSSLPIIQSMSFDFLEESRAFDPNLNERWPYTVKGTEFITQRMDSHDGICLMAEVSEMSAGYLLGSLSRSVLHGDASMLEQLYVLPPYRRLGVARALTASFFTWSQENGIDHWLVSAFVNNESAIKLYENLGASVATLTLEGTVPKS